MRVLSSWMRTAILRNVQRMVSKVAVRQIERFGAAPLSSRAFALRGGRNDRGLTIDDGLRPGLLVVGADDGANVKLALLAGGDDVALARGDDALGLGGRKGLRVLATKAGILGLKLGDALLQRFRLADGLGQSHRTPECAHASSSTNRSLPSVPSDIPLALNART